LGAACDASTEAWTGWYRVALPAPLVVVALKVERGEALEARLAGALDGGVLELLRRQQPLVAAPEPQGESRETGTQREKQAHREMHRERSTTQEQT
jgi:hypothetical protein